MIPAENRKQPGWATAGVAVGALAVSNVVTNRWLPPAAYVPWNLTVTGGMIALARAAGHDADEMGLDHSRLRRASRLGGMGTLAVGAVYGALLGNRGTRRLLTDSRVSGLSSRDVLWRTLVHIPLGTVVAEEVAFRGVLPVLLRGSHRPEWFSALVTSLLFGLWHLLPARAEAAANQISPVRTMVATGAVTTVGGFLLHRLRARAGHIVAPFALHVAANSLGLLAVRVAASRR